MKFRNSTENTTARYNRKSTHNGMSQQRQQLEGNGQTHTSLIPAEDWKTQHTKL
jgi:hypothetical protein